MNYSGEQVCSPHHAALMQCGEGLHVVNLVAGNLASCREIMDEGAFRTWVGTDGPLEQRHHLAAMGVKYRNDLLGHFQFGLHGRAEPVLHGTLASDHPVDHPANAVAAAELQSRSDHRLLPSAVFVAERTTDSSPRPCSTAWSAPWRLGSSSPTRRSDWSTAWI